ncbi:putative RiPP precursor [Mesorhizobium sp. M3A.F.Ca.ET.174.01.1.1]|nr:putative RiPP precursor [Mesorhizobium sp. M3A.F.Ca.ET.080.04.2.1]RWB71809.1 MAG: putative RiPP precursor [Mesorhizobium sp.]TGS62120.1 putative RiPP precursor [Mesorhizobium sp. M3A.F.Ca.ET.201.01.1.1]TGS82467.1 putative RiPP precursor [Mesorhizobium sp. M3A.F.Ca.ET.175.01.1.1]TGT22401.1 putative RiPP precursor [Mesorhizobium sp. M3A.F.Ca.ET.174.01.1.1]TGT56924.1 putative RiPP precursor [Mesorhizobium sp. M00.F.Ca.ET.170.01.1.1]
MKKTYEKPTLTRREKLGAVTAVPAASGPTTI